MSQFIAQTLLQTNFVNTKPTGKCYFPPPINKDKKALLFTHLVLVRVVNSYQYNAVAQFFFNCEANPSFIMLIILQPNKARDLHGYAGVREVSVDPLHKLMNKVPGTCNTYVILICLNCYQQEEGMLSVTWKVKIF